MINLDYIQEGVCKILNDNFFNYLFIKNFNINNKPPYPYSTINISTPYIAENETNRPNLYKAYDQTKDKIIYSRVENPQLILTFNVFSDDEIQAQQMSMDITKSLKFILRQEFSDYGIIVLEVNNIRNITGLLEVDWEYRFVLDVRIRVNSTLELEVDKTTKITLTDENVNKDIIIQE